MFSLKLFITNNNVNNTFLNLSKFNVDTVFNKKPIETETSDQEIECPKP